jgi:hypothetical protein
VVSPIIRYAISIYLLFTVGRDVHAACPAEVVMLPEQEVKTVAAVVVGKAIKQKYTAAGPGGTWIDGTYYTVTISSVEYGLAAKDVILFSENSSGRFPMVLNESYLLFVSSCEGVQYIDAKGNSGPLRKRLDVLRRVMSLRLAAHK